MISSLKRLFEGGVGKLAMVPKYRKQILEMSFLFLRIVLIS